MLKFSDISIPFTRSDLLLTSGLYKESVQSRNIWSATAKLAISLRAADLGLPDINDHKKLVATNESQHSLLSKSRGQSAIL